MKSKIIGAALGALLIARLGLGIDAYFANRIQIQHPVAYSNSLSAVLSTLEDRIRGSNSHEVKPQRENGVELVSSSGPSSARDPPVEFSFVKLARYLFWADTTGLIIPQQAKIPYDVAIMFYLPDELSEASFGNFITALYGKGNLQEYSMEKDIYNLLALMIGARTRILKSYDVRSGGTIYGVKLVKQNWDKVIVISGPRDYKEMVFEARKFASSLEGFVSQCPGRELQKLEPCKSDEKVPAN